VIFSELRVEDVLALRTTCSVFASVGLDYLGDELPLVFHRAKFKALTEIAEHPKLSKKIRSLFYVFDRCKFQSYENWDSNRPDPQPDEGRDYDRGQKFHTERDYRAFARDTVKDMEEHQKRIDDVPKSDLQPAYERFRELCQDITDVEDEGYDLHCLRVLFESCPKIREVTIASQFDIGRHLHANQTAFGDAMTRPYQDKDWDEAGVHQTLSVAMVAQQAGMKLDSLTLAHVSPTLFDPLSWEGEGRIQWPALGGLVQPLRRLRMFIHAERPEKMEPGEADPRDPEMFSVHVQCDLAFGEGRLHNILSSASDLRVLKLGLPRWPAYDEEATMYYHDDDERLERYTRLELALGDITYPKLYELSLSSCGVEAEYLVDLCLRHKATLRRLYLQDISLHEPEAEWRDVLTQLSLQLPQLRRIRLRGTLYVDFEPEMHFEHAGAESRRVAPYRDAVENFVLEGGEFPTDDEEILPDQADYPDENYRRPGLRQDNTEPDDPMLDYDWDEFDSRI
jgi:hypothetical protein